MVNLTEEKIKKWMRQCIFSADEFSTCAKRQYYAVLIDQYDHHIGAGWNGPPKKMKHCKDGGCPRFFEKTEHLTGTYDNCTSIHAEQNALLHSEYQARKQGCMLIVNGVPCMGCAKLMVNGGVKILVYLYEEDADDEKICNFLHEAGVDTRCLHREDLDAS